MKKDIKSGSEEFNTFGDIFSLYKEIGGVEETEEYDHIVITKINEFILKHDTPLGRELALALLSVLNGENEEQRYSRMITMIAMKAYDDPTVAMDFIREAVIIAKKWKGEK